MTVVGLFFVERLRWLCTAFRLLPRHPQRTDSPRRLSACYRIMHVFIEVLPRVIWLNRSLCLKKNFNWKWSNWHGTVPDIWH